jgi:hypothetical protein
MRRVLSLPADVSFLTGLATAGQTSLAEKSRFGTLAACNTLAWEDLQSFSQSPAESSQPAHPAAL